VQVTLRIPRSQLAQLVDEGAKRTAAAGRTITPQAVIMELIDAQFPLKPAE
jgi:Na+-translocating ferredoxin:NAD+ oxidoreductase RnfG subunit